MATPRQSDFKLLFGSKSSVSIELCLVDNEHVDGSAWRTTRVLPSVRHIPRSARRWLAHVKRSGAPVHCAMYRLHPDDPWTRVH